MQEAFVANIRNKTLFGSEDHLLLALSGGMDSTALAHLLHQSGYRFSIAHCNFQLRGADSEADEAFCFKLAGQLQVDFYVQKFDLKYRASMQKQSIQMAARTLRYEWFVSLLKQKGFSCLLTAHHASDVSETVMINLLRGTGIKGLSSLPEKKGVIIRPLLSFSKEIIQNFVNQNNIDYRIDKSNLEDKYLRNYIRLNIIPQLKTLNPDLDQTMHKNVTNFTQEAAIVKDFLRHKTSELCRTENADLRINKEALVAEAHKESLLNHILSDFNFNQTNQKNIIRALISKSDPGKTFISPTHQLTIDRKEIIVALRTENEFSFIINSLEEFKNLPKFKVSFEDEFSVPAANELIITQEKLIFPLTYRSRKTGDKFKPFGMKGFKLLSDYLKEQKLNLFEKNKCELLVNGNGDIIWVAAYRSDDRYKVTKKDKNLIKITLVD